MTRIRVNAVAGPPPESILARRSSRWWERAVRMVSAHRGEYDSEWCTMRSIAGKLGIGSTETLRTWVLQAEIDAGAFIGRSDR